MHSMLIMGDTNYGRGLQQMRYKDADNTSQEFGTVHMRQGSPDPRVPTGLCQTKGAFVVVKVYLKIYPGAHQGFSLGILH